MKILLVSLFLPHPRAPHAGGRYVYELLHHLSQRHEVDLVTRHEAGEEPLLADLLPLCHTIHPYPYRTSAERGIFDTLGLIANYLGFSRFADRLSRQGGYDLVQVEWVETALCIRRHGAPLVLDAHDVLSKPAARAVDQGQGIGRLAARVKLALVRRLELAIMGRCDRVITLSDFDREYLRRLWPAAPVTTIPIPAGLDLTDRSYERQP
ncbi:MAG TPA: glycosyltransferase, partial [Geobacteraceae bacterium]